MHAPGDLWDAFASLRVCLAEGVIGNRRVMGCGDVVDGSRAERGDELVGRKDNGFGGGSVAWRG